MKPIALANSFLSLNSTFKSSDEKDFTSRDPAAFIAAPPAKA
jgi:hypothetical protein